jgi:kumamolisin
MTKTIFRCSCSLLFLCLAVPVIAARQGAVDRGALDGRTPISVTIALELPGLNEAERLQQALYTPGDAQFHKFLTADQFVARFAPTDADIAKVAAALAKYGLAMEKTTATTLKVTGLAADMERAFSVSLHTYEVAQHDNIAGYTYHAPLSRPTIPTEISGAVIAVVGLDNSPVAHPHLRSVSGLKHARFPMVPHKTSGIPFGFLTVADFARDYDVNPLYKKGVTGSGRTIGVLTLAAFTPSDAYVYWEAVGLKVDSNRIKIVNIDGGPGAPSDASGSDETTLDVEQSGGVAPGANIIVYQAPNTNQGFLDLFAAATDANFVDTFSTSWGEWEWLDNLELSPVTDPITGKTVSFYEATHELLLRASIQGQSAFAASSDGGAYDVLDSLPCSPPYSPTVVSSCSAALSVDYPGSDPLITAGGGTTLPGLQELCLNAQCTPPYYDLIIPHERVWGWDYLEGSCIAIGVPDPIECGIFPVGSGGGVSVVFSLPLYQFGISGTEFSQPGQAFYAASDTAEYLGVPPGLIYAFPPFYPGRNLPDVSFNADPDTGYDIYYTSNVEGFIIETFVGGTSFVAPQLNGVTALLSQSVNQRIGLLNNSLYPLALTGQAWAGPNAPLKAIAYGDNWFYYGSNGYNLGAGLGTLDVANFAEVLANQF